MASIRRFRSKTGKQNNNHCNQALPWFPSSVPLLPVSPDLSRGSPARPEGAPRGRNRMLQAGPVWVWLPACLPVRACPVVVLVVPGALLYGRDCIPCGPRMNEERIHRFLPSAGNTRRALFRLKVARDGATHGTGTMQNEIHIFIDIVVQELVENKIKY